MASKWGKKDLQTEAGSPGILKHGEVVGWEIFTVECGRPPHTPLNDQEAPEVPPFPKGWQFAICQSPGRRGTPSANQKHKGSTMLYCENDDRHDTRTATSWDICCKLGRSLLITKTPLVKFSKTQHWPKSTLQKSRVKLFQWEQSKTMLKIFCIYYIIHVCFYKLCPHTQTYTHAIDTTFIYAFNIYFGRFKVCNSLLTYIFLFSDPCPIAVNGFWKKKKCKVCGLGVVRGFRGHAASCG